jgi:quinol monooxygenase YgiN
MLIIQAAMTAKPGQRDRAITAFRSAMPGSQAEPGCHTYRYSIDLDNPNLFHIVELWESEAALGAHIQGDPFKSFRAVAAEIVDPVGMSAYFGDMAPYQFPGT